MTKSDIDHPADRSSKAIQSLRKEMNARFDEVPTRKEMNARFDALSETVSHQGVLYEKQQRDIAQILEVVMATFETVNQLKEVKTTVVEHGNRLGILETAFTSHVTDLSRHSAAVDLDH